MSEADGCGEVVTCGLLKGDEVKGHLLCGYSAGPEALDLDRWDVRAMESPGAYFSLGVTAVTLDEPSGRR